MGRVYNFSAGPANLPLEVLEKAASEMTDYNGTGMSVMEISHRSKPYAAIMDGAKDSLRALMNIPDNYQILFLQGGASTQFAMVPLNLFSENSKSADLINTGAWSKKAMAQIKQYGSVNVVASSDDQTFNYIPEIDPSKFDKNAAFFHITSNNTIYGTVLRDIPDTGDVPLVADMSSNILSEPIDVSKYGIIYAGAQKNIGPAGLTIVIIREDLIGNALPITPIMLNYKTHADAGSAYNTPPCYSIYMAKLVFEWVQQKGGLTSMQEINQRKAALLYDAIDNSKLFQATVKNPAHRSIMNVPFVLPNSDMDAQFIADAAASGLVTLKGHRSVGGMRASIYNAMPEAGVTALVSFIKDYDQKNA